MVSSNLMDYWLISFMMCDCDLFKKILYTVKIEHKLSH